jgi:predicted RNA binding protein YcfA (HicA-like mRNA interferase family)
VAKLPVLKPREVVALLAKLGFSEVRQRGSHRQYRHADGRGTTVPFHQGRDISPTLVRQIAKDIGLSVEDFLAAHPAQQPNTALHATADEAKAKKPPQPGRG